MKKTLLLALPLLSLVVLAGCCTTDTCSPCTASATTGVVVAQAEKAPAVTVAKGEKILTEAEYQKLLAEGRVTPIGSTATTVAAAPAERAPAVRQTATRKSGVVVIPAVRLPEGWSYISEAEVVDAPAAPKTVAAAAKDSIDS
ncbi:MAG: hypothetical protein LIQ31_12235 [Planctomycetes bacterium]|nr:hypothetical protein [Planctomycetota bacterium]